MNLGRNEKLVISDIWSFWDYVIKKSASYKKDEKFMRSLLEQAKHFYQSAEGSPIKSQPLLYYYSFLNLAKIMINIRSGFGMEELYMHGMKEEHNNKFLESIIVKQRKKEKVVQVAHELVSLFDNDIDVGDLRLSAKELLNHCVGVHRAYSEIYNQSEIFIRVRNWELIKNSKNLIFNAYIQCTKKQCDELLEAGYNIVYDESCSKYVYREAIEMSGYTPKRSDYALLSDKIRKSGVWYFIGNDGYTIYLSLCNKNRYSQESIIYIMMFYLGSITRYHPYMFDEIFSDKEQWLMSEFLSAQPKQFLYLATANILGQSVLKAYSSF